MEPEVEEGPALGVVMVLEARRRSTIDTELVVSCGSHSEILHGLIGLHTKKYDEKFMIRLSRAWRR